MYKQDQYSQKYPYSSMQRANSQSYINNIQDLSLKNISEYFKQYTHTNGTYPDYLAKKILQTQNNNHSLNTDFENMDKIPGLSRLYKSIDNTMNVLRDKEYQLQNQIKKMSYDSQKYDQTKSQQLKLKNLKEIGYQNQSLYQDQELFNQLLPKIKSPQSLMENGDYYQQKPKYYTESDQPKYMYQQPYRMNDGFTLRLDFITGLPYHYQKIQLCLEFYLKSEKNIKCSWSQFYKIDIETFKSKRCLPYFVNIFKLAPQPNLHLFVECLGYDIENPDMFTRPIGKSWTTAQIFDETGELITGKFQLPFYLQNFYENEGREGQYKLQSSYKDGSFINIRTCIPNDPVIDINSTNFRQEEYVIPEIHKEQITKDYIAFQNQLIQEQLQQSFKIRNPLQSTQIYENYEDRFTPPAVNLMNDSEIQKSIQDQQDPQYNQEDHQPVKIKRQRKTTKKHLSKIDNNYDEQGDQNDYQATQIQNNDNNDYQNQQITDPDVPIENQLGDEFQRKPQQKISIFKNRQSKINNQQAEDEFQPKAKQNISIAVNRPSKINNQQNYQDTPINGKNSSNTMQNQQEDANDDFFGEHNQDSARQKRKSQQKPSIKLKNSYAIKNKKEDDNDQNQLTKKPSIEEHNTYEN